MSHWMCDDKSPVLPLRDLRPMCNGRPPEPKGDHSLVSQKGSNYLLGLILIVTHMDTTKIFFNRNRDKLVSESVNQG